MVEIAHLHTILDRLRETQLQHGALLQQLLDGQGGLRTSTSVLPKWLSFSQPIVRSVLHWIAGLLTMAYILKGGDLLSAIKMLSGLI